MVTHHLSSKMSFLPVSLLVALFLGCDGGPGNNGASSARSASQRRQACLDWCAAERELGCSVNFRAQESCTTLCDEGGSASCTDAGAVLACWQESPSAFGCSSSGVLVAAPPCEGEVRAYREANELCEAPTDFPAPGGGPTPGAAGGVAGSGG